MLAYAVCSAAGLIAGGAIAWKLKMPSPPQQVRLPIYVCAFAGAILGAKIPIWLSYGLDSYIIQGKSIMGGILGAFLTINLYKTCSGNRGGYGGRFVIPLAVAAGFGKIGCYLHGCCGGTLFVPVQLAESLFQFCMAFVLYLFYRKTQRADLMFHIYLLSYLLMRFIIEFWRIEPRIMCGLTAYQWIAIIFIPVSFLILWRRRHDSVAFAGK